MIIPVSIRKKLLFLSIPLLLNQTASSQIRLFLTGGVQSASVEESNSLADWSTEVLPFLKNRTGAKIGLTGDIPFRPTSAWSLRPGLLYSAKGNKFLRNTDPTTDPDGYYKRESNLNADYFDIPLLLNYNIRLSPEIKAFIGAGPAASVFYSVNKTEKFYSDLEIVSTEVKGETGKDPGKYKTAYFSANASAGFDFGGIMLSADYSRGLTDFYTEAYDGSFQHQTIGVSLHIRIARQKDLTPAKTPRQKPVQTLPQIDTVQPAPPVAVQDKPVIIVEEKAVDTPVVTIPNSHQRIAEIATQIQFGFGSIKVDSAYYPALNEIVDLLKADRSMKLIIEGHTDDRGLPERNKLVSQQRANAIRNYLISKGINADRLKSVGFGPDKPIADNSTEEGRAKNRRVVFTIH